MLDDLGSDKHSYPLEFLLEALTVKGISLLCIKKQEEAIECFDWALKMDVDPPVANTAEIFFFKGSALSQIERYDESIECFDKVIEIEPQRWHTWEMKGIVYGMKGNLEEEEKCRSKSNEMKKVWFEKNPEKPSDR